jgi:hypothetical protein
VNWTPDDLATLRRMVRSGRTDAEIGRHLNRDRQAVGRMRRSLDLEPGQPPGLRIIAARLKLRRLMALAA